MRKFFLISLMTLCTCVMAWATNPTTAEELQAAVEAATDGVSTTITLGATIEAGAYNSADTQVLNIPSGKVIVLDLDGKTISASLGNETAFVINNAGNLTIQGGGTITNTKSNSPSFSRVINNCAGASLHLVSCDIIAVSRRGVRNEGALVVEDGVTIRTTNDSGSGYVSQGSAIASYQKTATVRINGGTFSSNNTYCHTLYQESYSKMIIYGGSFTVAGTKSFYGGVKEEVQHFKVYGGTFSSDPSTYVQQSCYVVEEGGLYKVTAMDPVEETSVSSEQAIVNALSNLGESERVKLSLTADVAIEGTVTLPHGSEIVIPAGRTLTVRGNGLFINNGIVSDYGTIAISGQGFFTNPTTVDYYDAGTMSLEGYNSQAEGNVITYKISTPMHLQYLAYLVMDGKTEDKTWNISLENDITIPSGVNFDRIEQVSGVFDGKNHSIKNLTMSSVAHARSLFDIYGGTIKDVIFDNVNIYSEKGNATAVTWTLKANSKIENVVVNGTIASGVNSAAGFIANMQPVNSDMNSSSNYVWLVNCTNNATINAGGYFAGAFFATGSGAKGSFGFYNCINTGALTSTRSGEGYAGTCFAFGTGNASSKLIACTFTGSTTAATNGAAVKIGDINIIGVNAGPVEKDSIDATLYTAVWDGKKYVAQKNGAIESEATTPTTNWSQNTTWTNDQDQNVVPSAGDDVVVNNEAVGGVVVTTENAVAKSVTVNTKLVIQDGGKLTIGEGGLTIANATASVTVAKGATLIIGKNGVTNNGGTLVIEATQADGAGVVLVDPAATTNNHPAATIKLIPDAHHVSGDNYIYRYIGIPLYLGNSAFDRDANLEISDAVADTYLKSWSAASGWQNIGAWSELVPFKGYAISNSTTNNLTYTFKGNLMGNEDGAMSFEYGFNMFANSYTAPINIYSLISGMDAENVDLTIYMFEDNVVKSVNLGSFAAYEGDPAFTKIPSMQAFFVHVSNAGGANDEPINYAQSVFTPTPEANGGLYAPARHETPDFNRVRINVTAEDGASDAAYLIESASFTSEFDNGYDAVKYMNNGLNLYATTAHDRQSSIYSNDIEGTFIGIQGNGTYTMSFDKVAGEEYQIRDLQTNAVVTMSEANTYTFTANGTNDARFVVEPIAKMPTAVDNVSEAKMFINNNTLYISENNSNANIMIYGANGQLVLNEVAQPTISLNGLASGVYTIRVANQTIKFVK